MKAGDESERCKDDMLAHSLSLLWKEIVVIADRSVYDYKRRYDQLYTKFEQKVLEKVEENNKRFETERLTLRAIIERTKQEAEAVQKQIEQKN